MAFGCSGGWADQSFQRLLSCSFPARVRGAFIVDLVCPSDVALHYLSQFAHPFFESRYGFNISRISGSEFMIFNDLLVLFELQPRTHELGRISTACRRELNIRRFSFCLKDVLITNPLICVSLCTQDFNVLEHRC